MSKEKESNWLGPAMELFAKISVWIAFPVILALFLGSYLDKRLENEPWSTIFCVGVAFIITNIGLVIETVKSAKKMEVSDKKFKKEEN